jgi:hypothetical protein
MEDDVSAMKRMLSRLKQPIPNSASFCTPEAISAWNQLNDNYRLQITRSPKKEWKNVIFPVLSKDVNTGLEHPIDLALDGVYSDGNVYVWPRMDLSTDIFSFDGIRAMEEKDPRGILESFDSDYVQFSIGKTRYGIRFVRKDTSDIVPKNPLLDAYKEKRNKGIRLVGASSDGLLCKVEGRFYRMALH